MIMFLVIHSMGGDAKSTLLIVKGQCSSQDHVYVLRYVYHLCARVQIGIFQLGMTRCARCRCPRNLPSPSPF
jgi:hypothetical protein